LFSKFIFEFIEKFKDDVDVEIQLKSHNDIRSEVDNEKEMRVYADKYKLKFDGEYLYAFRDYDEWNRGIFNNCLTKPFVMIKRKSIETGIVI